MTRWLVVGGGAAGCVVAARLAASGDHDVTLLEAGPDHINVPRTVGPVLDRPELLRPDCSVVRRPGADAEPYPQGFGLGGSTLVNGSLVVGDPVEESLGHDLPIEPVTRLGPVARAVLSVSDFPAAPVGSVAHDGRRVTVAEAYLAPLAGRVGLRVVCDSPVERLAIDGRRAVGAITRSGDHVEAERVVLCAGAIGTPTVLLRSGIDTPGVGERLQDHVGAAIAFDLLGGPDGSAVAIGATVERSGRQVVVLDRLPGTPSMGALLAGFLDVHSEGRVTLPDPDGPALVELGQLTEPFDLDGLGSAVRDAMGLLRHAALRSVVGATYVDAAGTSADDVLVDDEALRAWLVNHLGGYFHPAGSCRPGMVLDVRGALRGYQGLDVGDASALPGVPLRNPYLTVVRHADRMATMWARREHRT